MIDELKHAVMRRSRARKLNHFLSLCPAGASVLDAGVTGLSGQSSGGQPHNHFLENHPHGSITYTGLGLEDMSRLEATYPSMTFVRYEGKVFPFEDKQFDWVFSNAVIEHVGSHADQLFFLNEMLRVATSVFFTTPNMYFPVEAHTNQLFRHWNRDRFNAWLSVNKPRMLEKGRLRLLGYNDVVRLLNESNAQRFEVFRNRLFGWTMTFSVVAGD